MASDRTGEAPVASQYQAQVRLPSRPQAALVKKDNQRGLVRWLPESQSFRAAQSLGDPVAIAPSQQHRSVQPQTTNKSNGSYQITATTPHDTVEDTPASSRPNIPTIVVTAPTQAPSSESAPEQNAEQAASSEAGLSVENPSDGVTEGVERLSEGFSALLDEMSTTFTPSPLQGPTPNERKFDRQLRLWGANGQQALEKSHILLINSGSGVAGVETLKNLVLPSIGAFTICDNEFVTEADLGVNFFLEQESLGKSRAQETCKYLQELNSQVQGYSIQKNPKTLLDTEDITKYDIVLVAAPQDIQTVLRPLAELTAKHSIPLIYLHCLGFLSHFSLQLTDNFPVVETHPDPETTQDLRLLDPWDDLLVHMKSKTNGLESMSDHDHGHVPYLLLLLHYLEQWKSQHGTYPENYADKREFRKMVQAGARTSNPEGGEENYDEAVSAVLKSLNPPQVPSGLRDIFKEPACKAPTTESSSFFLTAHAISAFVSATGALPLPGTLPDMKAQSADYIALQNLYRSKSQADIEAITLTIRDLESTLQRPKQIPAKEIEAFCKNASWVKLIHGRPLLLPNADGQVSWNGLEKMVARELQDDTSKMVPYIALLALDCLLHNLSANMKTFEELLKKCSPESLEQPLVELASKISTDVLAQDPEADREEVLGRVGDICKEIARYGPVELHNTAAHLGGMVAQEVIKLITKQYVPVDNTCVFDSFSKTPGASIFRL